MQKTEKLLKQFEVDWNDPSALRKLYVKLHQRRNHLLSDFGYKENIFNGSKVHADFILPIFDHIMNCNINHLYETKSEQKKYYVYFHCNPLTKLDIKNNLKHFFLAINFKMTHIPFYVGKGNDERWLQFNRNDSHRKIRQKLLKQNHDIMPIKIVEKLSESEALSLESKLIDILGLKCYNQYGLLVNLDEGEQSSERRKIYLSNPKSENILKANGFLL